MVPKAVQEEALADLVVPRKQPLKLPLVRFWCSMSAVLANHREALHLEGLMAAEIPTKVVVAVGFLVQGAALQMFVESLGDSMTGFSSPAAAAVDPVV